MLNINIKEPRQPAEACMIWMHGLGADAKDMAGLIPQLPVTVSIRHICLNAPVRPITFNNGMPMQAWYDIVALSPSAREDNEGIKQSEEMIRQIIDSQLAEGFKAKQIFLAGFSQGGAIALFTGIRSAESLGGIIALSAYLPLASACIARLHRDTPMFLAAGLYDPLIVPTWSKQSVQILQHAGFKNISWNEYPMEHNVCTAEMRDLAQWINVQVESITQPLGEVE